MKDGAMQKRPSGSRVSYNRESDTDPCSFLSGRLTAR